MAFTSSQLEIALKYDLKVSPKKFYIKDTTDYTGVTFANLAGNLTATAPDGTQFHNNTNFNSPDVSAPDTFSAALAFSSISGALPTGLYNFVYEVHLNDEQKSLNITSNDPTSKTITINGDYVASILDGSAQAFQVVDLATTSVTVLNAVYTGGSTVVTISQTLPVLTGGAIFRYTVDTVYTKTFQQEYTYQTPSVCINWTDDQCCSSMEITDVTVYPATATVNRLHTISYPKGITPAKPNITSTLQKTLPITPIWTGTWTDVFTADIDTTTGLIETIDSISGVKEHKVTSNQGLCQIYSCLGKMANKYAALLVSAPKRAAEMEQFINQASVAYMAYTTGKQCGETDYEQYLDLISNIAKQCDCGCDCADCADGTPVQVVGCCQNTGGSDFTILIQSTGGSITVSSSTVGTETTFEIGVSSSWFNTTFNNQFVTKSIDGLADVNTGNIAEGVNQVLYWDEGTNRWIRKVLELTQLGDVDVTGIDDGYVLYYDQGTDTFKFKSSATVVSIAACTDVQLSGLADKDILQWNGTKWVNVDNFLSLLTDVNTAGIADGSALEWDTATSKWIIYSPKKTLASLNDVVLGFSTPLYDKDRFQYVNGTGWVNVAMPAFSGGYTPSVGFGYSNLGYADFSASFDAITGKLELNGVITSALPVSIATPIAQIVAGVTTNKLFPIVIIQTSGSQYLHGIAELLSTGQIVLLSYQDTTGATQSGAPAGIYFFDGVSLVI